MILLFFPLVNLEHTLFDMILVSSSPPPPPSLTNIYCTTCKYFHKRITENFNKAWNILLYCIISMTLQYHLTYVTTQINSSFWVAQAWACWRWGSLYPFPQQYPCPKKAFLLPFQAKRFFPNPNFDLMYPAWKDTYAIAGTK